MSNVAFPNTLGFTGLNKPVRMEIECRDLTVIGEIPADIDGAFFRAVPDPAYPPLLGDDIALSGDGMVCRIRFDRGHVDYAIRYVETARHLAEKQARRGLFGLYRNPFTDDPSAKGVDRTVSNTTPVWHAGRLFMTKEDGRAYEVDPHTLATRGRWDFHGALRSETMTAHVRIDPASGEMFFFGYEAGGLCTSDIAYCIADANGRLVSEQWLKAPYCALMHDFAITEHYAIFPVYPTTSDLDRVKAGGAHWVHELERESWIGIMPRGGKVDELRWFKGPKGVFCFHILNAFEGPDGKVHLDHCVTDNQAFPFIATIPPDQGPRQFNGALQRWSFDLSRPGEGIEIKVIGPPGEMPRLRDADQGRPYRAGWYLSMTPNGPPPLFGGPQGLMFNCLLRIEPDSGRIDAMPLEAQMCISEPVHVPSKTPGHDGWLLAIVDRQSGEDAFHSELWIIDATDVAKGPVARVQMPCRQRPQVHGWWVSAEQLTNAMRD